jgi:hypothetical protein
MDDNGTAWSPSLPVYGPSKVTALLEQTGIVSSHRAAGLGERQRQAPTDALTAPPFCSGVTDLAPAPTRAATCGYA